MKKILILHASAGHGHEKAARAVYEALSQKKDAAKIVLLDSLDLMRGVYGRRYRGTYLFVIRHAPWLWGLLYYLTDDPVLFFFIRPLRRIVNAYWARPLTDRIIQEKPDVVICTHFMSAEIVSHLKEQNILKTRLITVLTDYMAHSFWINPQTDLYAVASEETARHLRDRGVLPDRVTVTGIPIEKKFNTAISRLAVRGSLNIGEKSFAVLVTSGGAGIGSMRALIQMILKIGAPIDILAVCGTNEELLKSVRAMASDDTHLHAFGFVENIHELMAACDVVIGKGGGLTVSESLSMGKPLILFASLPGQETRNAQCLVRHGAARIAPTFADVVRFICEFVERADLLMEYTQAARKIGRPRAADEIAQLALDDHSHG